MRNREVKRQLFKELQPFYATGRKAALEALTIMEGWLRNGQYRLIDDVLMYLDVEGIETETLLAIVTILSHAKDDWMKHRNHFVESAERVFKKRIGPERTDSIMKNRRPVEY